MSTSAQSRFAGCQPATWLAVRLAIEPAKIDAMRRAGELIAVREPESTVSASSRPGPATRPR